MHDCYVYILANAAKTLYVGATRNIARRLSEHRDRVNENSFTARYQITQLVHLEAFADWSEALAREGQLKGWKRMRKISLIEQGNPTWQDLSKDWE